MTASADRFLELLKRFNRKERFYLVGQALGNPDFALSDEFRDQVSTKVGVTVPKSDYFVAMDYHLNWIFAAAYLSSTDAPDAHPPIDNPVVDQIRRLRIIQGNQEDIDLIVAFTQGEQAHLFLIEAKGVTSFSNKVLGSKARRLKAIFGEDGRHFSHIQPHFVMVSPLESTDIKPDNWPSWMRGDQIAWLKLNVPDNLLRVTRCDENGKVTAVGDHWRVMPEKTFRAKVAAAKRAQTIT
jgi:hypothetical protein